MLSNSSSNTRITSYISSIRPDATPEYGFCKAGTRGAIYGVATCRRQRNFRELICR